MKKLQIILDSDEVIVETLQKVLDCYNEEYQSNLKKEEIVDWNLTHFQKDGTDILKYFKKSGFFRHLPIEKDAQYYIQKLIDDGHDVVIATSSPKEGILDKIEFFEEYFPFVEFENIIPITRKDLLMGDIMLDDAPHNLKTSQCKYPVIFDRHWNRNTEGKYSFLKKLNRIYSWKDFYNFVCKVANKEIKNNQEEKAS